VLLVIVQMGGNYLGFPCENSLGEIEVRGSICQDHLCMPSTLAGLEV
jgi:hypothetical protein